MCKNLVVVGASAGGVEALRLLVQGLPIRFPAAVAIVLHLLPDRSSLLPEILGRSCLLPVSHAKDNEYIRSGHVYAAPPDQHLLVQGKRFRLVRGPRENRHRPAIDPLFRTAAASFDSHAIGVILSGMLNDGTAGLQAIKEADGFTFVQDPREAAFDEMPRNAIENIAVDQILPVRQIAGQLLARLTTAKAPAHLAFLASSVQRPGAQKKIKKA